MSIVISTRLPDAEADLFKDHVQRHGLNMAQGVAALIRTAIAVQREGRGQGKADEAVTRN